MNRRLTIILALTGLVVGAGVALETTGRLGDRSGAGAAGGMGEYQGGCSGSSALPQGIVVENNETLGMGGDIAEITADSVNAEAFLNKAVPGRYVIKIAEGAFGSLTFDSSGAITSSRTELDEALEKLGANDGTPILDRIDTDIQPTWHFGLDEVVEFSTDAP